MDTVEGGMNEEEQQIVIRWSGIRGGGVATDQCWKQLICQHGRVGSNLCKIRFLQGTVQVEPLQERREKVLRERED